LSDLLRKNFLHDECGFVHECTAKEIREQRAIMEQSSLQQMDVVLERKKSIMMEKVQKITQQAKKTLKHARVLPLESVHFDKYGIGLYLEQDYAKQMVGDLYWLMKVRALSDR